MQLILHYLKRYKKLFVLNIISVFGFALVELGIPTIVSEMIDNGIMNQDKQYLIRMGIVIAVISLIGVSGTILLGYCCAKISTSVTRDIREDVFQKVQTFSHNEMNQFVFCMVFMLYPRASISAKRIMAVLNTETSIENHPGNAQTDSGSGEHSVIFEHVDFVYPDGEEAVLKDISFSAKSGETVAFIGSTGSGKSSLIQLIPRFYDRASGNIYIDGQKIEDLDINTLRSKIGFVPQKAHLFSGTIEENIRFGKPDATMDEIIHAAKIAQAYDFIMEKPHQFQEQIVEGATNVSGGQKQRLSIARALIRKPEIYIYDDSFSALDFKTDARLRKALKPEIKNAIVFLVAQRVSTILDADKIVVLDEGKIAGIGTHRELLASCPIYYEIAASQLSKEELTYA